MTVDGRPTHGVPALMVCAFVVQGSSGGLPTEIESGETAYGSRACASSINTGPPRDPSADHAQQTDAVPMAVQLSEQQLQDFEELSRLSGLDLKPGVARSLVGLLALGAPPKSVQNVLTAIAQHKPATPAGPQPSAPDSPASTSAR